MCSEIDFFVVGVGFVILEKVKYDEGLWSEVYMQYKFLCSFFYDQGIEQVIKFYMWS